jgi:hypothetical protein
VLRCPGRDPKCSSRSRPQSFTIIVNRYFPKRYTIPDYFSREAWVKTNQKNAMQEGRECGVGRLYSFDSRPVSVGSRGTEPNSQVLPSFSYSRVGWIRPHWQWLNGKTWQHSTAATDGQLANQPTNQPTKKLTKGGVLRKRQTSSLARFDHSCVRNAFLEMVKGALKL